MSDKVYSLPRKFVRGQVWMVSEPRDVAEIYVKLKDRTQHYTRPCVILTDQHTLDDGAVVINVFPITSKCNTIGKDDLLFKTCDGQTNRVLCNQIMTKDISSFLSYMYTMPVDIMAELEATLEKKLGIGNSMKELESKFNHLNDEFTRLLHTTEEALEKSIEKQPDMKYHSPIKNAEPIRERSAKNKSDRKKTSSKRNGGKREGKSRNSWTYDKAEEFLIDASNLSADEIVNKYGFEKRSQVYTTKAYCKKLVEGSPSKENKNNSDQLSKAEKIKKKAEKKAKMNATKSTKEYTINPELLG